MWKRVDGRRRRRVRFGFEPSVDWLAAGAVIGICTLLLLALFCLMGWS